MSRTPLGLAMVAHILGAAAAACAGGAETCPEESAFLQVRAVTETQSARGGNPYQPGTPGAEWSEEEVLAVVAKLHRLASEPMAAAKELGKKITGEHKSPPSECYSPSPRSTAEDPLWVPCSHYNNRWQSRGVLPSFPMMLRFGFHQCLKYTDGTGGCNGRLSLEGAFTAFLEKWGRFSCVRQKNGRLLPSPNAKCRPAEGSEKWTGHNANLALLADLLEEVYKDPAFPDRAPALASSLYETGKSRADLWALAALVAADQGFRASNKACRRDESYFALRPDPDQDVPCKVSANDNRNALVFSTGRIDSDEAEPEAWRCEASCQPTGETFRRDEGCLDGWEPCDWPVMCREEACRGCAQCLPAQAVDAPTQVHRPRPYETAKKESHAATWFNGSMLADFMKENFRLTKRQTVAIMGAHSFGMPHGEVSGGFRYEWTHDQTEVLNNHYYKVISLQDAMHFEKSPTMGHDHDNAVVGSTPHKRARTFAKLHIDGKEAGGGHFQWFHAYERCPFCENGYLLDRHQNIWGLASLDERRYPTADEGKRLNTCCRLCDKLASVRFTGSSREYRVETEGLTQEEQELFVEGTCLQNVSVHETFLTVDLGLHRTVDVGEGGYPVNRAVLQDHPEDVPLNSLQDEDDLPMHEIVEQYIQDPELWAKQFINSLEKTLRNGYDSDELTASFSFENVRCDTAARGGHVTCYRKQ